MGDARRRSHGGSPARSDARPSGRSLGHRAARAGILLVLSITVAGLVIVLATHRGAGPNQASAVIATAPPLVATTTGTVAVPGLPGDPPAVDPTDPSVADLTGLPGAEPTEPVDGPATPWPAPPADPTAAVDAAVEGAAEAGVSLGVVVIDRSSGATLFDHDANVPYPALSLLKVMIAADVLITGWPDADVGTSGDGDDPTSDDTSADTASADSSGETSSGEPSSADPAQVDALLTRMIATSDDEIASDLYEAAGGDDMVDRVAARYGMTGTTPTPDGAYWGNVQVTAGDLATLLTGVLADPRTSGVIGNAMRATTAIAADGVDQRFGMRLVPGAGSKQGWGCCLSGIAGIHSMGFTDDRIVVVLSGAEPDDDTLGEQDGRALQADPGAQAGFAAVDAVVRAALGGPAG